MPFPMAEENFVPIYTPQHTAYYAPGFTSGAAPSAGQPATPDEDDDEAGSGPSRSSTTVRRAVSPLANLDTRGGGSPYGAQTTPGSLGQTEKYTDKYKKGQAPLTAKNMGILAGNVMGITDPVSMGLASMAEVAGGKEPGSLGGVQNYEGYVGPKPGVTIGNQSQYHSQQDKDKADKGGGGSSGADISGGSGTDTMGNNTANDTLMAHGGTIKPRFAASGSVRPATAGTRPVDRSAPREPSYPWRPFPKPALSQPPASATPPTTRPRFQFGGRDDRGRAEAGERGRGGGYAHGGAVMGDQINPTGDERYTAPASIPDDGQVDNQTIQADEGEFVITRAAAEMYPPEVLEILNDPELADDAAKVLAEYFGLTIGEEPEFPQAGATAAMPPQAMPGMGRPRSGLAAF